MFHCLAKEIDLLFLKSLVLNTTRAGWTLTVILMISFLNHEPFVVVILPFLLDVAMVKGALSALIRFILSFAMHKLKPTHLYPLLSQKSIRDFRLLIYDRQRIQNSVTTNSSIVGIFTCLNLVAVWTTFKM